MFPLKRGRRKGRPKVEGGRDTILINLKVNCGGKNLSGASASVVCSLEREILDGDNKSLFRLWSGGWCRWKREPDTCDLTDRVTISVNKIRFRCQDTGK